MERARSIAVALFLVLVAGCMKDGHEQVGASYNVTKPWRQKVELNRQYVAQIRAIQHIDIRAFEKGYLEKIYVDEGQLVKKGDLLFQVMPYLMKAEYQKAKAEYDIAKIEFKNTERLARKKVVSANELALAKARLEKFDAELSLAKTHLDLTTVKAPFDGIIDRFRVRLGSLVGEGELLTTLSDVSKLWVYFNVSESDYLAYVANHKEKADSAVVRLMLANGKFFDQSGQIDTIEADFDSETGNVPFRATFPNPGFALRHGETGNVVLNETIDDALVIPQKATFEVLDKRFVYVVGDKGVIDAREIVVDQEVPHLFVVKSGLTENDTVVLEGLGKLNKGQVVQTRTLAGSEVVKQLTLPAE